MEDKVVRAWHFVGATLRDGRAIPPDGEWLEHDGPVVICESGLHASERIIDALRYAPGNTICRVECGGEIVLRENKLVCSRRKILWRFDGEAVLREFTRWCALSVIHLWPAPAVMREYLETGDESLRAAARNAVWDSSLNVEGDAPWDAPWSAKWAARDATLDSAVDYAWDAWDAWDSSVAAVRSAAAAAGDAASAGDAAASGDAQNKKFTEMVEACHYRRTNSTGTKGEKK